MTDAQKEVQEVFLTDEANILKRLQKIYQQASQDCAQKIAELASRGDMENLLSVSYQLKYQWAIQSQIEEVLNNLQTNSYTSIAEYLNDSYINGYVGTMYDLQQQGTSVITPIKQDQIVQALLNDSKLSVRLYDRLGEDVTTLKKAVQSEVSRGLANGSTYIEMAKQIATGMNSPFKRALSNAMRIARTEGHRVQMQSQLDALTEAEKNGAEIVKQWDATLDGRTRPEHQEADGQIRELDEFFDVGGEKLKAPGIGGSARNVVNCRCCMLQRARWALDQDELETLKERAEFYGLDKSEDFEEFREKYLIATDETNSFIKGITGIKSVNFVTDEYLSGATPGVGSITYEQGYQIPGHVEEVKVASWINNILGGNITLLNEINLNKIESPDYIWRGKMWELKSISNAKAADAAIRKGLKQIAENYGGIILDCSHSGDSIEETVARAAYRLNRSSHYDMVDVLIMRNSTLNVVLRCKK